MNASMLFVPATHPDRYRKAQAGAAGALILDLEDSVPAGDKEAARQRGAGAIQLDGQMVDEPHLKLARRILGDGA